MTRASFILLSLALVALIVFLFVSAPPPLPEENSTAGELIPIETALRVVAQEQSTARTLYTREIVGPGQKAGLAFDEKWREPEVEAGPLPALFLRETSASLQRSAVGLGLFLGSDFPIASANRFSGVQTEHFVTIRETLEPEFFFEEDTGLYTGMFPDFASAEPCVTCHNQHPESPKVDWVLNDLMGATTWSYPKEAVTTDELMTMLAALRTAMREAYRAYLEEAASFATPPEIGEQWPVDGYYLPSEEVFMAELTRRSSAASLEMIMEAVKAD
ncbi:MAG: hypothetical protein H0T73_11490 [Ardenticatenales bacterium]|nr:hypothetical protein [Ardenticatenales bacterium]